ISAPVSSIIISTLLYNIARAVIMNTLLSLQASLLNFFLSLGDPEIRLLIFLEGGKQEEMPKTVYSFNGHIIY
ncbi:hypothetical protein ACJX0J_038361, partial [Zea mays]